MKWFVVLSLTVVTQGFIFGPSQDWDGLRVTWGINPFDSYTFSSIPRTESQAISRGWLPLSKHPSESYFCGKRYSFFEPAIAARDPAVMPIYDKNGFIAGFQTGISDTLANGYPPANLVPPFIHEPSKRMVTLTAYFVPPDTVCGAGRTQEQFDVEGTGTQLTFLFSNNTVVTVPYRETDLAGTLWTKGKCFYTMGQHYFGQMSSDMDCADFFPIFLMYNGGRVNAFGFAFLSELSSPRYERPSFSSLNNFMTTVPTCLSQHTYSSIHVYMDDSPRTNTC